MNGTMSAEALRSELIRRGLLTPSASAVPVETQERPWFISVVLGAAGWLAGVFALVFVALLFKPDSTAGITIAGFVLLIAAFGLYAVDRDSQFLDQFALALSIAGQFAMVWASLQATNSITSTAGLALAMQLVLLFLMPNPFAKVLAAFFACCAWALLIRFGWWEGSSHDARQPVALGSALMGWFAVWVPIIVAIHALVATESSWMPGVARQVARAALTGSLVSLAVGTWISEPFGSLMFWDEQRQKYWMELWPLLGAIGALLAVIYAFRVRSRALIGVATLGALLHVGQFYYLLSLSLLTKSCIMLVAGGFALLAAAWLQRRGSQQEDVP
jgi:hypothetical protein